MPGGQVAHPVGHATGTRLPATRQAGIGAHDIIMQYTYSDRCIIILDFTIFSELERSFTEDVCKFAPDRAARSREKPRKPGPTAHAAPSIPPPVRRIFSIVATVVYVQIGSAWNRNRGAAARAAIADAARRFESDILLIANGLSGNAKDSVAIASLQVHGGTSAQVLATGPDEEAALHALLPLLQAR